jgi:hypothetical protein
MNDDQLDRLFAAARREPPDTTRAQAGFAPRLAAQLRAAPAPAPAPGWAVAWQAVPLAAAVVIALLAWNLHDQWTGPVDLTEAGLGGGDAAMLASYLTGD